MSSEDYTDLREGQAKILARLVSIESILGGDGMKGEAGVIQNHRLIMLDLYGKDNGVLHRISQLEDNSKKIIWMSTGFSAGAGLVIGLLFKAFGKG